MLNCESGISYLEPKHCPMNERVYILSFTDNNLNIKYRLNVAEEI